MPKQGQNTFGVKLIADDPTLICIDIFLDDTISNSKMAFACIKNP